MSSIMLNPAVLEGKEVSHGYRIVKYVSRGAFSIVYKAQRLNPEETVAIKLTPINRLPEKQGYQAHTELYFKNFQSFCNALDKHRLQGLSEIERLLKGNH